MLLTSPSIWAALVSMLAWGLALAGYTLGAEDQQALTVALPALVGVVANVVSIIRRVVSPPARLQ